VYEVGGQTWKWREGGNKGKRKKKEGGEGEMSVVGERWMENRPRMLGAQRVGFSSGTS
jgi:hypothetical protein